MLRRVLALVAALALIGGWLTPAPAHAALLPRPFLSAWQPYWMSNATNLDALNRAAEMFTDVSPFFFEADVNGNVNFHDPPTGDSRLRTLIAAAKAKGIPTLPTITDGSGTNGMQTILLNTARRADHIAKIVARVNQYGADGIDLDYENFAFSRNASSWPINQPAAPWVTFVRELGDALHAQNKLLAITIPPVWGVSWDYKLYAPEQIHPFVDFIRPMVYDWSVSNPGPIAPLFWVDQVIAQAKKLGIPPSKLQLGVPSYGRHWRTKAVSTQTCPLNALGRKSVTTKSYYATQWPVSAVRDPTSGELKMVWDEQVSGYTLEPPTAPPTGPPPTGITQADGSLLPAVRLNWVTCTVRHTVFMSDEVSIRARADRAAAAGWRGMVLWALGYETVPATVDALRA